jgi:hypothetical protein
MTPMAFHERGPGLLREAPRVFENSQFSSPQVHDAPSMNSVSFDHPMLSLSYEVSEAYAWVAEVSALNFFLRRWPLPPPTVQDSD